jgi:hypothetical protein
MRKKATTPQTNPGGEYYEKDETLKDQPEEHETLEERINTLCAIETMPAIRLAALCALDATAEIRKGNAETRSDCLRATRGCGRIRLTKRLLDNDARATQL